MLLLASLDTPTCIASRYVQVTVTVDTATVHTYTRCMTVSRARAHAWLPFAGFGIAQVSDFKIHPTNILLGCMTEATDIAVLHCTEDVQKATKLFC